MTERRPGPPPLEGSRLPSPGPWRTVGMLLFLVGVVALIVRLATHGWG